jgi:SAM-dependent methyltransferase
MVYFSTLAQVRVANQHLVGKANYLSHNHTPDALHAVRMACLQDGESVLDLGCAGAKITALAKQAVGSGVVVGVDGVAGFLNVDATAHLASSGLTVAPTGTQLQRVHLVKGSVTDGNLQNLLASATGEPACYNVIFLIHVFETIPPEQRCNLLRRLNGMLAPAGRIIISMSARFTNKTIAGPDLQLPVQFRSSPYTEAPGSFLVTTLSSDCSVTTADGTAAPARVPCCMVQTAPGWLWDIAIEQAQAAATHTGLRLIQTAPLSAHDFGLPHIPDLLPSAVLAAMTPSEITDWMGLQPLAGYQHWGNLFEALARHLTPQWDSISLEQRSYVLVDIIQQEVLQTCGCLQHNARKMLRAGVEHSFHVAAHNQLAVLVELRV